MKKVQHMVVIKFKRPDGDGKIGLLFEDLRGLAQRMPGVLHFSGGPYSSPEGLNQGFTHGFLFTFASAHARNTYLAHPEHQRLVNEYLPILDSILAFDFEE